MKKNNSNQSGMFNMRIIFAVTLCMIGGSFGWLSLASTPSTGTLTPATPILTYDAGPLPPNQTPEPTGLVMQGPACEGTGTPAATCDSYALTITLPAGYVAANPNAVAKVTLYWANTDPTGNEPSDYDLYIFKGMIGDIDGSQK
ncbi:MAG TPA: hypothetical protein VLK33_03335, partial [Terriglobales bacterium]|nr:hypothetical protein [Terriglobales bacterium]